MDTGWCRLLEHDIVNSIESNRQKQWLIWGQEKREEVVQNNLEIPTTVALISQEDYYLNYWIMDFCIFHKDLI